MKKKLIIGCDNAGISIKTVIKKLLDEMGYEYEDVGVSGEEDQTYYPNVAKMVCEKIISSGFKYEGILICGTGIGMAITANKYPGIYAAVCHDSFSAERARLSNDTNVICMGARIIGPELAKKVMKEWLSLEFRGGSSQPKVDTIKDIEHDLYRS